MRARTSLCQEHQHMQRRPRLKQCVVFTVPLSRNQPIADHTPYRTLTLKNHHW